MNIDFYVLETNSRQKAYLFACELLEKSVAEKKAIFVHTNSREEAEQIDGLLWTYRDDSFLPHCLYHADEDNPAPIQIGYGDTPKNQQTILLNLNQIVPAFYQQFTHVIEIVFTDPVVQQLARTRYKHYRDHGHNINTQTKSL